MSVSDPDFSLAFIVAFVAAAALATIALRRAIRARARERRRVVEQPNSHYTSPVVRSGESRHRWQSIDLDSIHEVNRGEVKRLLARVEASGTDALRESERVFLDQFVTTPPPKPAVPPRETGRPLASDLRHRPA